MCDSRREKERSDGEIMPVYDERELTEEQQVPHLCYILRRSQFYLLYAVFPSTFSFLSLFGNGDDGNYNIMYDNWLAGWLAGWQTSKNGIHCCFSADLPKKSTRH